MRGRGMSANSVQRAPLWPEKSCGKVSLRSLAKFRGAQWLADQPVFAMMRAATGCLAPGSAPVGAPVAELVDAPDSKSGGFTSVLVRVRPGAPFELLCK